MRDDWEELEKLAEQAQETTREFVASTRGGAGSPIERRMADAFTDVARSLSEQARAAREMGEQQRLIASRLEAIERATERVEGSARTFRDTVSAEAGEAVGSALHGYRERMDELKGRADRAISALGALNGDAAESYRKAVEGSVRRLAGATSAACALVILAALAGGVWALVGASWFARMSPEIQAWATSTPALVIGIGLPVAVFLAGYLTGRGR